MNALDLGADDYVTKPFGPEELLARIRVALRRVMSDDQAETGQLRAGDLTIDYDRRRVLRQRGRDPADAEGIRAAVAAGAQSRSRADASRDSQGDLGAERRRAAGAPLDAGRAAAQEDRARSGQPALPPQRAVGRLPVRRGRRTGRTAVRRRSARTRARPLRSSRRCRRRGACARVRTRPAPASTCRTASGRRPWRSVSGGRK